MVKNRLYSFFKHKKHLAEGKGQQVRIINGLDDLYKLCNENIINSILRKYFNLLYIDYALGQAILLDNVTDISPQSIMKTPMWEYISAVNDSGYIDYDNADFVMQDDIQHCIGCNFTFSGDKAMQSILYQALNSNKSLYDACKHDYDTFLWVIANECIPDYTLR